MSADSTKQAPPQHVTWGAFAPSTDPFWCPLTAEQAEAIDRDRAEALMRIEAGMCPLCAARVEIHDGWARCPNRGHARGPKSQGPVEFRLIPVEGVARFEYRETGETVGPDGRPLG